MKQAGKIILDCERMKYPFTGLYYYCAYLAQALMELSPRELCFYVPKKLSGVFGEKQCYLLQKERHKAILPSLKGIRVWHSTHQSTDYYPDKKKTKLVLTIHDLNYLYDESKSKRKKQKYIADLQQKIDRADQVVTISQFTKDDVTRHFQVDPNHISVIYNGCTITPLDEVVRPELAPDRPFLFTIGTIVEKKNFHVLPALLQDNDFYLVIAGITHSNSYKESILAEGEKFGVKNRILFTGGINENDKQWYYQHCAAFVFPSISEGFGLPVIEAMHFGKPVLLSTHTCLPEIGVLVAYYFECFDVEAMRKTIS
jgi:glycosyltransferase involved in cell wall biosynthesis